MASAVAVTRRFPPALGLTRDGRLLFAARSARMFGYGSIAVILVLYLARLGLDGAAIGLILSLTLIGDIFVSLWLTTHADRLGRRRTLEIGAVLMAGAGVAFALTDQFALLLLAATIGVISPSGNEVGPFLAVEQASLTETIDARRRTSVFAWYNLAGSIATAFGALGAGLAVGAMRSAGVDDLTAYRVVIGGYALIGIAMAFVFRSISPAVEVAVPADTSIASRLGLRRSRNVVLGLSALFSIDAFAGGLVFQSILAYWFHVTYGVPEAILGVIFFAANILAAVSALAAASIASRIGLINTMVFTHLPSNILLILVPLMPTLPLAILVLLARFSISQMDVPTRQSYVMAVVRPEERSAAAGITGVARTTGAAIAPVFAGWMFARPSLISVPFFIAGTLKVVYDLLLYRGFVSAPERGE